MELTKLLSEIEKSNYEENYGKNIELKKEEVNYRAFNTTLEKFIKGTFPNKKLLLEYIIKTYLSDYEVYLLEKEIYKIIEIFLRKQGITIVKTY